MGRIKVVFWRIQFKQIMIQWRAKPALVYHRQYRPTSRVGNGNNVSISFNGSRHNCSVALIKSLVFFWAIIRVRSAFFLNFFAFALFRYLDFGLADRPPPTHCLCGLLRAKRCSHRRTGVPKCRSKDSVYGTNLKNESGRSVTDGSVPQLSWVYPINVTMSMGQ